MPLIPDSTDVLIVGCGDIGQKVARLERSGGCSVAALARSEETAGHLAALDIAVVRGDLDIPVSLTALPYRPRVLYWFAPPPDTGIRDTRLESFLAGLQPAHHPTRLIYISTSGVYGDCQGDWVTEERIPAPRTDRARRRLSAEQTLIAFADRTGIEYAILRVPGIYGPNRLPVERLRKGLPVIRPEEAPYSNRIHADDLARVCYAAARSDEKSGLYNVSDGHPTSMTDYFMQVADLLGLPYPPCISMEEAKKSFSANLLSFIEESRRIDNRFMLKKLGISLRYPDLTHGLPACLQSSLLMDR